MKNNKLRYLLMLVVIVFCLVLVGCGGNKEATEVYKPIYGFKFPSWDFLVWPMAALMYGIGKVTGGSYGVTIIIATLVVRTIGWPIYAKSNDMTLKMQLMAPEQAKIEAKYANRTDQESQQRKQMEMMQLMKKYGVGLSGCLTPFIQLPIFIAFYETLRRIPSTRMSYVVENNISIAKLPLNFDFLKGNFFGLDLFSGKTDSFSDPQTWGIWVLAILVGATQILSQILINKRQKRQKESMQSDIPQYRRPEQTEQQKQTETMMKMMLYGMPLMMVVFIISSPAALGLYWLVGNVYSTLQSFLGSKNSSKRLEMLRAKMNK